LVLVSGNLFTIAAPVRAAVQSIKGTLSASDFTTVAQVLKSKFWDGQDSLPPIEVIDATINAVLSSQNPELSDFRGFVLPSVLYRVSKEYYDQGGQDAWELAQKFVQELLLLDPGHRPGLVLRAKTLVRLSQWSQAREAISDIQKRGIPEYHYLNAFMFWKKREYRRAVTGFRAALAAGQDSMEIYHGLASCLVRLSEFGEAEIAIKRGLRGRRPNSLLLDLAAQIAITQEHFSEAEDYIDQLRRIRAFNDHNFRLAMLNNARKQFQSALPLLEFAMKGSRRRFEVEATLIDTLIEVRQFNRASEILDDPDSRRRLGRDKEYVRFGLRCKLCLRQNRWQDAERAWLQIHESNTAIHMALRADILKQKIADLKTSPGQRATAQAELNSIQSDDSGSEGLRYAAGMHEPEEEADSEADGE
jgi:thioredoxin-like negative regulator of GroEL